MRATLSGIRSFAPLCMTVYRGIAAMSSAPPMAALDAATHARSTTDPDFLCLPTSVGIRLERHWNAHTSALPVQLATRGRFAEWKSALVSDGPFCVRRLGGKTAGRALESMRLMLERKGFQPWGQFVLGRCRPRATVYISAAIVSQFLPLHMSLERVSMGRNRLASVRRRLLGLAVPIG